MVEPIPQFLAMGDEGDIWKIYYEGQEPSCWKCHQPGHRTNTCENLPATFVKDQAKARRAFEQMKTPVDTTPQESGETETDMEVSEQGAAPTEEQTDASNGQDAQTKETSNSKPPRIEVTPTTEPTSHSEESNTQGEDSDDLFVNDSQEQETPIAPVEDMVNSPFNPTPGYTQEMNEVCDRIENAEANPKTPERNTMNSPFNPTPGYSQEMVDACIREEKKKAKKMRQKEKKRQNTASENASPKRNKLHGSLTAAPLGEENELGRQLSFRRSESDASNDADVFDDPPLRPDPLSVTYAAATSATSIQPMITKNAPETSKQKMLKPADRLLIGRGTGWRKQT